MGYSSHRLTGRHHRILTKVYNNSIIKWRISDEKKVLALAAAITLVAPLQNVAFAHENDGEVK